MTKLTAQKIFATPDRSMRLYGYVKTNGKIGTIYVYGHFGKEVDNAECIFRDEAFDGDYEVNEGETERSFVNLMLNWAGEHIPVEQITFDA